MGLSEHWIAVRVSEASGDRGEPSLRDAGFFVLGKRQGWTWARGWPERTGTDEIVTETARSTGEPCIGAWVFDSDFGYVVGAASDGTIDFQLAIKEPYEEEDEFSRWAAEQWRSPQKRREAAESLAGWSEHFAPGPIAADQVLHALRDDEDTPEPGMGPVFAEDALREIFEGMGFPNLDQTVFLPDR